MGAWNDRIDKAIEWKKKRTFYNLAKSLDYLLGKNRKDER